MKVRLILLVLFICGSYLSAVSQQLYAIKPTSNWNDGTAWSTTQGGPACGCTPTALDDVFTDGRLVVVNVAASCKNLLVNYDIANSVTINSFLTLTVTGTLSGWDPLGPSPFPPNTSVIKWNVGSSIKFTGANVDTYDPYVIFAWSTDQPISTVNFALAGTSKNLLLPLTFNGAVTLSSGTLNADAGVSISGTSFSINSGAAYISSDPIGPFNTITAGGTLNLQSANASLSSSNLTVNSGGTVNSSGPITVSNNITVTGTLNSTNSVSASNLTVNSLGLFTPSGSTTLTNTLTLNSGGQINASGGISTVTSQITGTLSTSNFFNNSGTLNLNAGSNLITSYTGGTEGWWSNSNSPATMNVDPASTVTFSANSSQNVFAQAYGNLALSGSGAKTVTGAGTLNVKGNLTVGSPFNSDAASSILIGGNLTNNAAWAPADEVTFNGTGSQQIGGTVLPTFLGGLDVNKSAGTLSLLRSINIATGLTISQGTFDAANYTTTLSGALTNSGTLSFGSGATLGTLVIDGSTTVSGTIPSFGHLTVNATRSFTSSGTINVAGNITNNGTFNVTGIAMNGTSPQSISGTLALSNLTVRDAADVSNLGTINMSTSGVVTLEGTGLFDAGAGGSNTLRLQSNSLSNGARIAPLPNPDRFSGNVTVERYINAPEDWRYLSFPVLNANVGMVKDDFPVTGNFSDRSDNGGLVTNNTSPSIFYLNAGNWTAVGSGGSVASTSLSNTRGYSVWAYISAGTRLDVDGEIGKGPKSIAITTGDNLIPNPYPSAIDWDLVNTTGANLSSSTIYVRTSNGQYASYSGGMTTGNHPLGAAWNGQISTGQAFWVLGAGSGTLTLQEDDKTASTNFVREVQPRDFIRIRLNKDTLSDDVIVHFKENATIDKDVEFDAPKKLNDLRLNISAYNDDPAIDFAINGVPFIGCDFTTRLKLASTNPVGNYTLSFEDLSSMTTGYEIELVDKFLEQRLNITEETLYHFTITTDPTTSGADRFEIIFKSPAIDASRELAMESMIDCEAGTVSISIQNSQPGVNYQFGLNGVALSESVPGNGGTVNATISAESLTYGDHSLALLVNSNDGCHSLDFADALMLHYEALPVAKAESASVACGEGSITLNASGAPVDGSYRWYESEEATTPIDGATSAEFTTPVLSKSTTYFVAAVNASGCESANRIAMQASVFHPEIPVITVQGDALNVAEGLGNYEWYLDGQLIDGANTHTYQVEKSGTYTVNTSANGCSITSEGFAFIVNGNEHKILSDYYKLYPNPVEDVVRLSGPDLDESKVAVFDRSGKEMEIKSRFEKDKDGNVIFVADFSNLRNGMYLLNIIKRSQLVQLKVIKR